jgi:phosphatidylinositol glycan class B
MREAFQIIMTSKFLRNMLVVSLLLHIASAFLSAGFYHSDEHFQILEFLNYKLGLTAAHNLPIEFGEKIRPWLQPALYLALIKPLIWVNDWNPFHWVLLIRLFSSLIGWLSLVGLALISTKWIENPKLRNIAILLCALLWFLPGLHARHSSENLSGSLFYLTLSILFLSETKLFSAPRPRQVFSSLAFGFFFGACFEFRYQVGFLVAGLYFYWLFYRATQPGGFRILTAMFSGTVACIAVCTLVDHWGYGVWTFAPWNYFHYNLILNHVSDVDTHPLWDFFRSSFTETFPPLGPLLLSACVLGWIIKPSHPLTWASLPLFIVHTLIGHKELRFLFPIAHAAPLLAVQFLDTTKRFSRSALHFLQTVPGQWLLSFLFVINLIALLGSSLIPVWMPARFFEQLYPVVVADRAATRENAAGGYAKFIIFYKDKNPFDILGLPLGFYRPPNLETVHLDTWTDLEIQILDSRQSVWFFQVGDALPSDATSLTSQCHLEVSSLPRWAMTVIRANVINKWTARVTNWTLYRCHH